MTSCDIINLRRAEQSGPVFLAHPVYALHGNPSQSYGASLAIQCYLPHDTTCAPLDLAGFKG